jgi:putative endonuclease
MYWVYILESQLNASYYIGYTQNLDDRLSRHNSGYEKYTKKYIHWKMIYSTSFSNRGEAMKLEKKLKSFKNRDYLEKWISENLS